MSSKLRELSKPTTYRTAAELRSILGRPLSPCPTCACPILAVLHDGVVACPDCLESTLWDSPNHRPAAAVALLVGVVDGVAVEIGRNDFRPIRSSGLSTPSTSH